MKRALAIWLAFLVLLSVGQVGTASAMRNGWCLIQTEYLVSDGDNDVCGGPSKDYMSNGAVLWNYLQDTVGDHTVVIDHYRTDDGGGLLARARWQVEWEDPAAFFPAGEHASVAVEHIVLEIETWTPPSMDVKIDAPDLWIGGTTSSPNTFHQPNGGFDGTVDTSAIVYDDHQVMTSQDPLPEGGEGDRIALYINFGLGYGMRYTYTWGAEAEQSAAAHAATPAPFPVSPFGNTSNAAESKVLWTNQNISTVKNGAQTYYVIFELESDAIVTSIQTYHSLGGAEPGELTLYAESGSQWGPFQATGAEGQGGVSNAYWIADTGELELPAGRYAVADSDPTTWSCNAESGYDGFLEVRGYISGAIPGGNPFASATKVPDLIAVSPEENIIGLWLSEPLQSGEQMLLNILPDAYLELYYGYYQGSGNGDVKSLMDDSWEFLDLTVCGYAASETTLTLYTGTDSENVMSLEMEGMDTMRLTDEWGATFILHRASQEQADSWQSWNWGVGTEEGYDLQEENGKPEYNVDSLGGTESDLLEGKLIGLWLSEPVEDGNQVMLDIWEGGALELFYCCYTGSGEGSVESLLDGEWDCLVSAVCSYSLSADVMYLDNGYDEVSELAVELPEEDVLYLTDEYENLTILHRASPTQEDAWRSWAWGTINPQGDWSGESYDGENAALPEGDQLDDWMTGLWLSDADADGNQTLIRVLPDDRIELYPCTHYGNYGGTLNELTDGSWDFIGPEVFQYYVAQDMLTLYHDDGSVVIWAMNILDDDTVMIEDEFSNILLYERATPEQEAGWLEWMKQYKF